jgi:hypothetical protein
LGRFFRRHFGASEVFAPCRKLFENRGTVLAPHISFSIALFFLPVFLGGGKDAPFYSAVTNMSVFETVSPALSILGKRQSADDAHQTPLDTKKPKVGLRSDDPLLLSHRPFHF